LSLNVVKSEKKKKTRQVNNPQSGESHKFFSSGAAKYNFIFICKIFVDKFLDEIVQKFGGC